ncbi:MAG: DUF4037 domain-containing protein [Caldilineaceae bacterium]
MALNGIQLSEHFYWEAVRPLLDQHYPGLPHAAALLGNGSEVLGYDDVTSTDHHWGPRVQLFVRPEDFDPVATPLHALLADRLPRRFGGYPTNFSDPDPFDHGVQHLEEVDDGPVNHRVDVLTAATFVEQQLNFDLAQRLQPIDWLTFPEQKLLSITAGAVFYDTIGLAELRQTFAYYPHDVWLYLLAAAWARIGQEEHLMGRAGQAGDELGSGLIGARLVRDIMRLCFLMERTYAPYPKWFGTAFRRLHSGRELYPILQRALAAATWQAREEHLGAAYEYAAAMHNRLQLTAPLPERTRQFFGRPFRVIALHGYADALCAQIQDAQTRALAEAALVGGIDLVSDNVDIVSNGRFRSALRKLYELET